MTDKTPQQLGHEFQDKVQTVLDELHTTRKTKTQRLYDTKSAGAMMPSQPADFFTVWYGKAFMIEAKASVAHRSMAGSRKALTSLVGKEQAAKIRVWERAGAVGWYIFKSVEDKEVEIWPGTLVAQTLVTPKATLDEEDRIDRFPFKHLQDRLMCAMEAEL